MDAKKQDNELAIARKALERSMNGLDATLLDSKIEFQGLLRKADGLLAMTGGDPGPAPWMQEPVSIPPATGSDERTPISWENLVATSRAELEAEGIGTAPLSSFDLLSPGEVLAIANHLKRPMYERFSWDKIDYIMAFGAGACGWRVGYFSRNAWAWAPGHDE